MSDPLPSVTVLIPTKPDQAEILAVTGARAFDYPPDKLEILVARGRQPSVQRNTGLRAARGELVCFLDVMTGQRARQLGVGGEVLCKVW